MVALTRSLSYVQWVQKITSLQWNRVFREQFQLYFLSWTRARYSYYFDVSVEAQRCNRSLLNVAAASLLLPAYLLFLSSFFRARQCISLYCFLVQMFRERKRYATFVSDIGFNSYATKSDNDVSRAKINRFCFKHLFKLLIFFLLC